MGKSWIINYSDLLYINTLNNINNFTWKVENIIFGV